MNRVKPSLAALGISAALATGSASAALTLDENGRIFLEDDDIDFHLDSNLDPVSGGVLLQEGDVLFSVVEFNEANGDNIEDTTGQELTGVLAGQIIDITISGTTANITFAAYDGGLQPVLDAVGGYTNVDLSAYDGSFGALFLGDPDLEISADNVSTGTVSCDSVQECVAQATDGDLWEVDGFTGDPDPTWGGLTANPAENEFWFSSSSAVVLDTGVVLATDPAVELINFNIGATILEWVYEPGAGVDCFPLCSAVPDTEFVDVLIGGTVKGGDGLSDGLIEDGAVATSDFDLVKTGVPEPSTLALLAAGLIGVGAARRRKA